MHVDLPAAFEKYWAHITLAAGGLWTVIKAWSDHKTKRREAAAATFAARAVAKLDLTKLAQEAAAGVIQTLREEVDHWTAEVGKLREELKDLQTEMTRMVHDLADKDAEIALLKGRNRQLEASIAAHRRMMIAAGLELPAEPAYFEIRGGELRPMGEVQ